MSLLGSPRRAAASAGGHDGPALMPFPRPFPADSPFYPVLITLAGVGRKGFVDGHRLTEAYFCGPLDACHLPDFSLIISDGRNNSLRRLDLQTDTVTTLMTHAFLGPRSPVVIDGGAAVVLCDSGHNKVRMVQLAPEDSARVLQDCTIAGTGRHGHVDGPANAAAFARPLGLCVIHDGSILVADSQNHAIRRIAGRPGRQGLFVTTVIGGGGARPGFVDGDETSARLNCPTALAVDAHGTVLIVDAGNAAVRALHLPPGRDAGAARGWALTTICGDGSAGYADGPAAQSARLREPVALALGGDGELLISDAGNHAVRALLPLGAGRGAQAAPLGGGGLFRVGEAGAEGAGAAGQPRSPARGGHGTPAPGLDLGRAGATGLIGVFRVGDLSARTAGPGAHWTAIGPADALRATLSSPDALQAVFAEAAASAERRGAPAAQASPGSAIAPSAWMHTSASTSPHSVAAGRDIGASGSFVGTASAVAGGGGFEHASRLTSRSPAVQYVPYHDPAAVLAAHERYAHLITVAGAPPPPPAAGPAATAAPDAGRGYADGHATAHARLHRPHGLCALSGGVGAPVLVLDSGNNLVRLLVSRASMDLQPVILRPVIPADAVSLARRIIIERRAELIAAAPREATLSPRALASSLRRTVGWPEQQRSPLSGGLGRVPSAAASVSGTTVSGFAPTAGMAGGGRRSGASTGASTPLPQGGPGVGDAQARGAARRQSQQSSSTTAAAPPSERIMGHTASSLRRLSQRSGGSTAVAPPPTRGAPPRQPQPQQYNALVEAAAPAAVGSSSGSDSDKAHPSDAAPSPPDDTRMTLEEIANAADFAGVQAASPPSPPLPPPPPLPTVALGATGGVKLTRADVRPPPPAAAPLPPATALSPAVTPELASWRSAPFAASTDPRGTGWAAASLRGVPPPTLPPFAGGGALQHSPLGHAPDPVGAGLIAASVFASRHAHQEQSRPRSAAAAASSAASASSVAAHAGGRVARPHPGEPNPPDQRHLRAGAHPQLPGHLRALGDGEIFRAAADLVSATAAAASGGDGGGRGSAHYARPTSAQRQRVSATPRAAGGSAQGGSSGAYAGTTGPSTLSGDAVRRRRGPSADSGGVRLRVTEAGHSAVALPGDGGGLVGVGGAPLSHDSHLAGTHTPAFWAHHELCPDRSRVVVNQWFSSRDALAHEDADAAGAVVQALLLSDSVGGGGYAPGHPRRGSASSATSGLINARFTRHTASSASSLRARGRKVVRAAPAFVNVAAVVSRKLEVLRSRSATARGPAREQRHGAQDDRPHARGDWGGEDGRQREREREGGRFYDSGGAEPEEGGGGGGEDGGEEDGGEGASVAARTHASAAASLGPAPGTADHVLYSGVEAALSPAAADRLDAALQRSAHRRLPARSSAGLRQSGGREGAVPAARGGGHAGTQTDTTGGGDLSLLAVRTFHPAFGSAA